MFRRSEARRVVMTGTDILVITAGPLCQNPRAAKEASTLAQAGHAVTVLTAGGAERFEAQDREFVAKAGVRKIIVQDPSRRSPAWHASRLATWLARRAVPSGVEHPQALGPYRAQRRAARRLPCRLAIVHTEIGLAIGRSLQAAGTRVAADIEDWHSRDLLPEARRYRPLRLLRELERHHLHHAAYASTTSHALAHALHVTCGGSIPNVIRNVFPLSRPFFPRPPGDAPSLVWFSQTIGPGRGLEPFLDGWSRTRRPSRITLIGDVAPSYRAGLFGRLPAERRPYLGFQPAVPARTLPDVLRQHDLGLALELAEPPSRDLTITNKVFQYMDAGLGLLATATTGQREVLTATPAAGTLLELGDSEALAAVIDALLASPERIATAKAESRRAAERVFCWEREQSRFLELVTRALAATPAASPHPASVI